MPSDLFCGAKPNSYKKLLCCLGSKKCVLSPEIVQNAVGPDCITSPLLQLRLKSFDGRVSDAVSAAFLDVAFFLESFSSGS